MSTGSTLFGQTAGRGSLTALMALVIASSCTARSAPSPLPTRTSVAPSASGSTSVGITPVNSAPSPAGTDVESVQRLIADLGSRLQGTVAVGGEPEWITGGYGSIWVTNRALNKVQRVDPDTDRPVAQGTVIEPCNGIVAAFGSIWTASCHGSLVRLDPTTLRTTARIPTPIASNGEGQLAVGFGDVWVSGGEGMLERVDPATDRIVRRIPIPRRSNDIVAAFDSIWVSNPGRDAVIRVDPRTNRVVGTIHVGPTPRFMAAGGGALWTLNQEDGTVSRIDPNTGAVTSIRAESAGDGGCLAAGLGAVWLTVFGAPLTRVDLAGRRVTEQFLGAGGDCVTVGFGSVWLVNNGLGTVSRIAPP
jgi:virginiamycin B lyase